MNVKKSHLLNFFIFSSVILNFVSAENHIFLLKNINYAAQFAVPSHLVPGAAAQVAPPPQLRLWKEAVVTHLKIFFYCSHDEMKTEKNACHGGRWLNPDPNPVAHNNSSCKIFALHVP
jgi:hypothetical protein